MIKRAIGALVALCLTAGVATAQDYPSRPVRAILALSSGGIGDVFMRAFGEQFQKRTGQPIIVENRPGGAFNIGGRACADSAPDGYTICLLPVETLAYNHLLFKAPGYDPRSFETITNVYTLTLALVVNASLGIKSLDALAAASKAKPGTMAYTTPAVSLTVFMENWKKRTGADLVRVPFRGGADALAAILQGSVPVSFSGLAAFVPHIRSGAMSLLAVDTERRSPLFPEVPTLRELGYTGPLTEAYSGLVAPKGTPRGIIHRLHSLFVEIAGAKDFAERNITSLGMISILNSPEQFAAFLEESRRDAERVVKDAGLEPQ